MATWLAIAGSQNSANQGLLGSRAATLIAGETPGVSPLADSRPPNGAPFVITVTRALGARAIVCGVKEQMDLVLAGVECGYTTLGHDSSQFFSFLAVQSAVFKAPELQVLPCFDCQRKTDLLAIDVHHRIAQGHGSDG